MIRWFESREQADEDLYFVGEIPLEFEEKHCSNVERYFIQKQDGGLKLILCSGEQIRLIETLSLVCHCRL